MLVFWLACVSNQKMLWWPASEDRDFMWFVWPWHFSVQWYGYKMFLVFGANSRGNAATFSLFFFIACLTFSLNEQPAHWIPVLLYGYCHNLKLWLIFSWIAIRSNSLILDIIANMAISTGIAHFICSILFSLVFKLLFLPERILRSLLLTFCQVCLQFAFSVMDLHLTNIFLFTVCVHSNSAQIY